MTNGSARALLPAAFVVGCLLIYGSASAQLVLGQYEDEAPLGTWNIFGAPSASSFGLGLQFAWAADPSVSLTNPALLSGLPKLAACLSSSYTSATLNKFSLVNTGVVTSSGNLAAGVLSLDHGALAFRSGRWAFALAVAAPESYGRPHIAVGSSNPGSSYELRFEQTGYLRVLHAAVARRLAAGVSVGLGLNYAAGTLERSVVERSASPTSVVTITDFKQESLRGFFLNGGIAWEASDRLTASLVFRSPYIKRGAGQSLMRYEVPEAGTDIRIEAEATNEYRQPGIIGAGCAYRLSEAWNIAAELTWFGWSAAEVTFFDEPLARSFRSIVRAGAGGEYLSSATIFGRSVRIPFRLGFTYDPQPMGEPRSAYLALAFGTGIRLAALAIDVSGSFGRESGSGYSLQARKIVLSLRYIFDE